MKLLHRTEDLHPCDIAEMEYNAENLKRLTRKDALTEQILSVAAKFEAYLTAPETVLSERESPR